MTKIIFIYLLIAFSFSTISFADKDHTAEVCSVTNPKVCAHVGHMSNFSSKGESTFVAHVMTPKNEAISNFKADLWMPAHGHGSTPMTIAAAGVNKYKVTKAAFSMTGEWQVRMSFEYQKAQHEIAVPVTIAK